MAKVAEVLAQVVEELDERGWCQGSYHNQENNTVCLVGALNLVLNQIRNYDLAKATKRALKQQIWATYGSDAYGGRHKEDLQTWIDDEDVLKAHSGVYLSIEGWNDTPGRTVEDVQLLLKQTIEAEEAKASE